ncbi:MAG: hypothetical protein ACRDD1_17850, partial [Planctomycetia bacterium]
PPSRWTVVRVGGAVVGSLNEPAALVSWTNEPADAPADEPAGRREVRLAIPPSAWRAGSNLVEIGPVDPSSTDRIDDVVLHDVVLEFAESTAVSTPAASESDASEASKGIP